MLIEARELRVADVVRIPGDGEREIRKLLRRGERVGACFRGVEGTAPHAMWAADAVLEIQRPGSLFGEPTPAREESTMAKTKSPDSWITARSRLLQHMRERGWKVDSGPRYDYATDPTDSIRVQVEQKVVLQQRERLEGLWEWPSSHQINLGTVVEFVAELEGEAAKLQQTAQAAAESRNREEAEEEAAFARRHAPLKNPAGDPLTLRYSKGEGVLLCGETYPYRDGIKAVWAPTRFRFSRALPKGCAWYVHQSRGRHHPRSRLEQLADALRREGVPVVVDYVDPGPPAVAPGSSNRSTPPAKTSASSPSASDAKKRADKMRRVADKLQSAAKKDFEAERLENTPRRARMAASARARAARQMVIAKSLRAAAEGVEAGELVHMSRVSTRAQVEQLDGLLRRAAYERARAENRASDHRGDEDPTLEDVAFAKLGPPKARDRALQDLLTSAKGLQGLTDARQRLSKAAKRGELSALDDTEVAAVRALAKAVRAADGREIDFSTSALLDELLERDRLARIGVVDTATLQAVLREYLACCRGGQTTPREDPKAARRRELQFAKIPGYFPTPLELGRRMVAAAEIEPGMRVLEPSAGSGAIAEVIRREHPQAPLEVIEHNLRLRKLLEDEGFFVVGQDFCKFTPKAPYDRILMNPPFEKRQDVEHIRRAITMLKPGGRLVAIAAAGLGFRTDKKTRGLAELLEQSGATIEALPAGTFKDAGTQVSTVLITFDKATAPVHPRAKPRAPQKPESPLSRPQALVKLGEAWSAHQKKRATRSIDYWKNIPKTSCFVREEGDVSVTLCTAIQKHAVGTCPPSMAGLHNKSRSFMLCQVDEDPEFFPKAGDGIHDATAEAHNAMTRSRRSQGEALGRPEFLPAADDFEAQQHWLSRVVPTGIVYKREQPFRFIGVGLAAPEVVTKDGKRTSFLRWTGPLTKGATLEPRVQTDVVLSMPELLDRLGKDLRVYAGAVAPTTVAHVLERVPVKERARLAKDGVTMEDVQHGRFGGRSVYWLTDPTKGVTYGPVTARGKVVTAKSILKHFEAKKGAALELTELPKGMSLDETILVAMILKGRRAWFAWSRKTNESHFKTLGEPWELRGSLPLRGQWAPKVGFDDFMHRMAETIHGQRNAASPAFFRVAGPWLGALFPSDYDSSRVTFDSPTGGLVDVARVEAEFAEYLELAQLNPQNVSLGRWAKLGPKRVKWAKQWRRREVQGSKRAEREAATAAKEKTTMSDKKTNSGSTKKAATAKKKAATKKPAAAKKTAAQKPTAKKPAAKKTPTAKKTAATKKPAAKKTAATKKPAAKKTAAAKKPAAKKTAAAKKPAAKKTAATKKPAAKKTAAANKPTAKKTAAAKKPTAKKPTPPKAPKTTPASTRGSLRLKRHDLVRFRKRSQVAAGLGIAATVVFEVQMVETRGGQISATLRLPKGRHDAYIKVPVGHLALVKRHEALPADTLACAAKLARLPGMVTKKTRLILAEMAKRA